MRLACKLGAEITVDASKEDPVAVIQKQIGGAHGVLVTAVSLPAFQQAGRHAAARWHLRAERSAAGPIPDLRIRHGAQWVHASRLDRRNPSGP